MFQNFIIPITFCVVCLITVLFCQKIASFISVRAYVSHFDRINRETMDFSPIERVSRLASRTVYLPNRIFDGSIRARTYREQLNRRGTTLRSPPLARSAFQGLADHPIGLSTAPAPVQSVHCAHWTVMYIHIHVYIRARAYRIRWAGGTQHPLVHAPGPHASCKCRGTPARDNATRNRRAIACGRGARGCHYCIRTPIKVQIAHRAFCVRYILFAAAWPGEIAKLAMYLDVSRHMRALRSV